MLTLTFFPRASHADGTISSEAEFRAAAVAGGVYVLQNDINISSTVMITGNLKVTSSYSYPAVPPKLILDAPITVIGLALTLCGSLTLLVLIVAIDGQEKKKPDLGRK